MARELLMQLDQEQLQAMHGILFSMKRVQGVSGPAGSGKSALLRLIALIEGNEIAVLTPTNGARRADQAVIDSVLDRGPHFPNLEVTTTFAGFGVSMGGKWNADAVVTEINKHGKYTQKAEATYNKRRLVLDEAGQTFLSQVDMADKVGPQVCSQRGLRARLRG